MEPRLNPRLDPVQLRKRVLLFYFAAGVNLLMALWVGSVGATRAPGGTVTIVTLVFIGFAGINYYMARKLQKYLRQLMQQWPGQAGAGGDIKSE
jgi:hypothetical protein